MLRIFIGYDPRETVAYHVLCNSILRQASGPVQFTPINKQNISEYHRSIENGSTEFSYSRFLTPYLSGYHGQSIFMDCDMLCIGDIYDVLKYVDMSHDVFVVKHDYTPKTTTKFLGNKQEAYPKKNWSSFMVFNNFMQPCKRLTPEVVNNASGPFLHRFEWTRDERIGSLPLDWNHLVSEYGDNPNARIVHFTLGTPCFEGYEDQEWSVAWRREKELMNAHK